MKTLLTKIDVRFPRVTFSDNLENNLLIYLNSDFNVIGFRNKLIALVKKHSLSNNQSNLKRQKSSKSISDVVLDYYLIIVQVSLVR
jgi:hypothetical protein